MSVAEVARRVGLSSTPCWRRIQKLEEAKVIRARVALLDRKKINVSVSVFVSIRTNQHNLEWMEQLAEMVETMPEVIELYRMSGDIDYLMHVVVPDIDAYDAFYKRLVRQLEFADLSSSFAMERIKGTTELPLAYA